MADTTRGHDGGVSAELRLFAALVRVHMSDILNNDEMLRPAAEQWFESQSLDEWCELADINPLAIRTALKRTIRARAVTPDDDDAMRVESMD
jgi:hypothetical protein